MFSLDYKFMWPGLGERPFVSSGKKCCKIQNILSHIWKLN